MSFELSADNVTESKPEYKPNIVPERITQPHHNINTDDVATHDPEYESDSVATGISRACLIVLRTLSH